MWGTLGSLGRKKRPTSREMGLWVEAPTARIAVRAGLFCGHFFGFAFGAHGLELPFGFFELRLHFGLDFFCRVFQLR